ncbi:MAG: hypothetical protein AABZ74_04080 [Cyanobacteriota bacterium]
MTKFSLSIKITRLFIINLVVFFSLNLVSFAELEYPSYTGKKITDISGKFDSNYLSNLESQVASYDYEMRIVFISTEGKVNLAFYAPKLFEMWKMNEDSVLVVIDPYKNKFGYAIGKEVRKKIKEKKVIEDNNKISENTDKVIDYDNLVNAIDKKFLSPKADSKKEDKKKNNDTNSEASNTYKYSNSNSNSKKNNLDFVDYGKLKKYALFIILLGVIIGGAAYVINKKNKEKKQLELKTNYTFDADIQIQDINTLIEKIDNDILKMNKYIGSTKKELKDHILKLIENNKKAKSFIDKITQKLEELEIEDIYELKELLDDGNMNISILKQIHQDSLDYRKDFKMIQDGYQMSISDIRVNIESCKNLLEETKMLFPFPLLKCSEKINDMEIFISNHNLFEKNDPLDFKEKMQTTHKKMVILKKELSIIPHLYKQLQEDIPLNISSYLDESLFDSTSKNKIKNKVNDYRNNALISLSDGDLQETEELINKIFKSFEVKNSSPVEDIF